MSSVTPEYWSSSQIVSVVIIVVLPPLISDVVEPIKSLYKILHYNLLLTCGIGLATEPVLLTVTVAAGGGVTSCPTVKLLVLSVDDMTHHTHHVTATKMMVVSAKLMRLHGHLKFDVSKVPHL